MSQTAARIGQTSESLTRMGKTALVAFGAVAGSVGLAVRAGFALETTYRRAAVGLTAILGSSQLAEEGLRRITVEATQSRMELIDLIAAFQQMAASFMAAYRDPQKSMDQAIRTIRAFGDLATTVGASQFQIERGLLAVRQMLAKPTVQMEELRQLAEAFGYDFYSMAYRAAAAMGKTIAPTAEVGRELRKAGITGVQMVEYIVHELESRFGGAQRNLVNTFEGTVSNLKDAWANLSRQVFGVFVDPITAGLKVLKDELSALGAEAPQRLAGLREGLREIATALSTATVVVTAAVITFSQLPAPMQQTTVRIGALIAAITGLLGVIGIFGGLILRGVGVLVSFGRGVAVVIRWLAGFVGALRGLGSAIIGLVRSALPALTAGLSRINLTVALCVVAVAALASSWPALRRYAVSALREIGGWLVWLWQRITGLARAIAAIPEAVRTRSFEPMRRAYERPPEKRTPPAPVQLEPGHTVRPRRITSIFEIPSALLANIRDLQSKIRAAQKEVSLQANIRAAESLIGTHRTATKATSGLVDAQDKLGRSAGRTSQAVREQRSALDELTSAVDQTARLITSQTRYHYDAYTSLRQYADGLRYVAPMARVLALRDAEEGRRRLADMVAEQKVLLELAERLGDIELAKTLVEAVPVEASKVLGVEATYGRLVGLVRELSRLKQEVSLQTEIQSRMEALVERRLEYTKDLMYQILAGGDRRIAQLMAELELSKEEAEVRLRQVERLDLLQDIREAQRYLDVLRQFGPEVARIVQQYPHLAVEDIIPLARLREATDAFERMERQVDTIREALSRLEARRGLLLPSVPTDIAEDIADYITNLTPDLRGKLEWALEPLRGIDLETPSEALLSAYDAVADRLRKLAEAFITAGDLQAPIQAVEAYGSALSRLIATILQQSANVTSSLHRQQEELTRDLLEAEKERAELVFERTARQLGEEGRLRELITLYAERERELLQELDQGRRSGLLTASQQVRLEREIVSIQERRRDIEQELRRHQRRYVTEMEQGLSRIAEAFFERILSGTASLRSALRNLLDEIRREIARIVAKWIVEQIARVIRQARGREGSGLGNIFGSLASSIAGQSAVLLGALGGLAAVLASGKVTLGKALLALITTLILTAGTRRRLLTLETLDNALSSLGRSIRQQGAVLYTAIGGLAATMMTGKVTLGRALMAIVAELAVAVATRRKQNIWAQVATIVAGFLQSGGQVVPRRAYVVGEKGPELFVPESAGRVVPLTPVPLTPVPFTPTPPTPTPPTPVLLPAPASSIQVTANFYGDISSELDIRRVARELAREILVARRVTT
ncbi:tape measure protein [Thermogutta sp.]|uniref:tape measure protein n=1 Tax=Thermogutta sp. TaxID=1962930 RepID=UPI00321FD0AF